MTKRKPAGYPCHVDEDLAHVAKGTTGRPGELDVTPTPCSRRHAPVPHGAKPGPGLLPRTAVRLLAEPEKAPKSPPATSSAARSTPKRATPAKRSRGHAYDDKARLAALDVVVASGIAAAHKATGIPKATLSRWARDAGIDLEEQARERTRAATAAIEARTAEAALSTVDRLEGILTLELTTHARLAELEAAASASMAAAIAGVRSGEQPVEAMLGMMGNPYLVLRQPDSELGQLLGLLELGKTLAKRDVVGAWTRAVHDLALLKGDATERGTILVRFGIPRPAGDVDAGVVDEAQLEQEPPA